MSFNIMSAADAYAQTMAIIQERDAKDRAAAEDYITAVFVPALFEAIGMGRSTLMLKPSADINSFVVSNILREHGYRTRVSNPRRPGGASIEVYWNCEEDDDE